MELLKFIVFFWDRFFLFSFFFRISYVDILRVCLVLGGMIEVLLSGVIVFIGIVINLFDILYIVDNSED